LGFLGNSAPYGADINLLAQILVLLLLLGGTYYARSKRYGEHGRIMKTAVIVQLGALVLWMGRSLLLNIGALGNLGAGPLVTASHAIAGAFALFLSFSATAHKPMLTRKLKGTMRMTMLVWASAAALGIAFYVYYYFLRT
jgi:uncharacterized membrane protein YozB (DUF420 family)